MSVDEIDTLKARIAFLESRIKFITDTLNIYANVLPNFDPKGTWAVEALKVALEPREPTTPLTLEKVLATALEARDKLMGPRKEKGDK